MSPRAWTTWYAVLILSAYLVPFTVLRNVPCFHGAFLFWCAFALAAIATMMAIIRRWREEP